MRILKMWSLLLTCCLLMGLFAGCTAGDDSPSSGQEPSSTPAAASEQAQGSETSTDAGLSENVVLRVIWWGSQDRHDRTLKAIDLFTEEYPNMDVEPEYLAWGAYWEKLAAQAAAGTLPDVMQNDYNYIGPYAEKGLIIPLDDYVPTYLNLEDCDPATLDGGRVDGKLYGVNLGTGSTTIAYDPALLESAGVAEPDHTWTYNDYEAAMEKIHETHGIYGAQILTDGVTRGLEVYTRQYGMSFYTEDGKALNFTEEVFANYFAMNKRHVEKGLIPTPDIITEASASIESNLVATGRAAMTACNSNQVVALQQAAGRELKLATIPTAADQTQYGAYLKASMLFSISRDCENPEYAATFIDFFTNDIAANRVLEAERGVPVSKKVQEGIAPDMGEAALASFDYINSLSDYVSPIDPPQPAAHSEVSSMLDNYNQQIMFDQISIEQAAAEFFEKAKDMLQKA